MGNAAELMGVSQKVSRRQVCQENLQIQTLSKMSSISRQTLKLTAAALRPALQRNLATSYILAQAAAPAATDPVQGLFLDKIRAYATAKKAGGALVDATPATEATLQTELGRVAKQFGGGEGVDMTKFPGLKWSDPELQSLELGAAA